MMVLCVVYRGCYPSVRFILEADHTNKHYLYTTGVGHYVLHSVAQRKGYTSAITVGKEYTEFVHAIYSILARRFAFPCETFYRNRKARQGLFSPKRALF